MKEFKTKFIIFTLILFISGVKFGESVNDCEDLGANFEELKFENQFNFVCNRKRDEVTDLMILDFSLEQISDEIFDNFPKLNKIWLELKNQNIELLNKKFFAREAYEDLKELEIFLGSGSSHHVENVEFSFLKKFSGLEKLWIRNFNFTSIKGISSHSKLKELMLSHNNVEELPTNLLKNLKNLENLNFRWNDIEVLQEKLLSNNKKLETVDFSNNKLKKVPLKIFEGLIELKKVVFSDNQLHFLPLNLFEDNKKLKYVEFRFNQITKLSSDIFTGLILETKYFLGNPCATGANFFENSNLENCYRNWEIVESKLENVKSSCGVPPPSGQIYWGHKFPRGKYPWVATLSVRSNNQFFCGASLITNRHALTAAHCMKYIEEPSDFFVLFGRHNLSDKSEERNGLKSNVLEFIVHPQWDAFSGKWDADIAVIVLETEIQFTGIIQPICLSQEKINIFHGQFATAVGWGLTENLTVSKVPFEVDLRITDPETCYKKDSEYRKFYLLEEDSYFCAGNRNKTGTCEGDSGGAVFVKQQKRYYAVGIVSFGFKTTTGECDTDSYQANTNVEKYYEWIQNELIGSY